MKKLLFAITSLVLLYSCGENPEAEQFLGRQVTGKAQGTTYTIIYHGDTTDYKPSIDSLLAIIDAKFSLWSDESVISEINAFDRTDSLYNFKDENFIFSAVFDMSLDLNYLTDGAFDPTVYPLVEAWGFGAFESADEVSEEVIDSLLQHVGFDADNIAIGDNINDDGSYGGTYIRKANPNCKLDFNAIAQGYSVDLISGILDDNGVQNYMAELGGEVVCKGLNPDGNPWRIGIDKPVSESQVREFEAILNVTNRAVATSGNYRNYYVKDGKRYSHTIDPRTGYPVDHNLLSVTVMASSCGMADGFATAFMVMGLEETVNFLVSNPDLNLEAYLIFDNNGVLETVSTQGMVDLIEEQDQTVKSEQ